MGGWVVALNSDTVTGGGRVLTRSKGGVEVGKRSRKKKWKAFIERLQLDGSTNSN